MAFMEYGEAGQVARLMDIAKEHGLDLEGALCQILARVFPTQIPNTLPTRADEVTTLLNAASDCGMEKNAELFQSVMDRVYPLNSDELSKIKGLFGDLSNIFQPQPD